MGLSDPQEGYEQGRQLALVSGVSSQHGALRAGFMSLFCSPTVPIKGAQGCREGLFKLLFLESSVPGRAEARGAVGCGQSLRD